MAISLVATVAATPGLHGGVSTAINTTGATLVVVSLSWVDAGGAAALSDAKGNVYTGLTSRLNGGIRHQLWYVLNPVVGAGHTFTVSGTSIAPALLAYAFAGVASFQTQSGTTSAPAVASLACGSVTPATAGALVFTGNGGGSATTATVSTAGFTVATRPFSSGVNVHGAAGWLVQSTAAAINPTWAFSPSMSPLVSAAVFEAIPPVAANVRVTQDTIEALSLASAPGRVTQTVVEILSLELVDAYVTQYVVEALSDATLPKDYTWQIKDLTDASRWMTGLLVFPVGETPAPSGTPSPTQVVFAIPIVTQAVFHSRIDPTAADECGCD